MASYTPLSGKWPDPKKDTLIYVANPIEAELPSHWIPLSVLKKHVENRLNGRTTRPPFTKYSKTTTAKIKHTHTVPPYKKNHYKYSSETESAEDSKEVDKSITDDSYLSLSDEKSASKIKTKRAKDVVSLLKKSAANNKVTKKRIRTENPYEGIQQLNAAVQVPDTVFNEALNLPSEYMTAEDSTTQSSFQPPILPTLPPSHAQTQPPSQTRPPTQPSTQSPTQPSTQSTTQPSTQSTTQPSTQSTTQPSTQSATQPTTKELTTTPTGNPFYI